MTPIKLCGFQNNSTKKYRLLCLESNDDGWSLWETGDLDYMPDPHSDKLVVVRRPATFADYEQRSNRIVESGYTKVGEQ
jgi:hypothetical protein